MAYSRVTYIGDGSNTIFTVPFEYLKKSFVKVVVAEEPVPSENFEWLTSTSIKLAVAPAAGSTIYIYRDTEKEAPVTGYRDGSVLTGSDLDNQTRQLLHIAQETQDVADEQMRLDSHDLKYDAQGRVIKNVADPVDDTDAMTYRAWKQDIQPALDASLVNATIKANQAEASAVNANSSALLASGQATISGQHARESEVSASASAQSAIEAKVAAEEVKATLPANFLGRVETLEGRTAPATTTSRGIARVATLADIEPGAVIENGPAVLAAGSDAERLLLRVTEKYDVGEFYYFRHPTIKPGFAPLQGGLISGVYQGKNITEYPIWDYLQTTEGQLLCKTEAEWQAMTTATWATLADGTTVGWGGIGGAPFYVQNLAAGTLRMPDVRGMYPEAAGFDSLGVGGVHGDAIRQISGNITGQLFWAYWNSGGDTSSAMYISNGSLANVSTGGSSGYRVDLTFSASRRVPTATKNQPRAWGALACAYLGQVI